MIGSRSDITNRELPFVIRTGSTDEKYFALRFNTKLDTVPVPVPINFTPEDSTWYFVQQTEGGAAVNYWLADSTVWKQDTLQVHVSYPKSDSLNILRPQTDTVQLVLRRRPAEKKKKKKKDEPDPIVFLGMQVDAPGSMDLFDTISVTFNEPVLDINKEMFFLDQKIDTVWNTVDFDESGRVHTVDIEIEMAVFVFFLDFELTGKEVVPLPVKAVDGGGVHFDAVFFPILPRTSDKIVQAVSRIGEEVEIYCIPNGIDLLVRWTCSIRYP